MISVFEARQRLLSALSICEIEPVPLNQAAGRVLAEDVVAAFDAPPFANSSMDGFAIRGEDLRGATPEQPVLLEVVGDIPAGSAFDGRVGAMQAARIMTGAAMPVGADSVVPVEDTDAQSGRAGAALPAQVSVYRQIKPGGYVRLPGEDYRRGDTLVAAGTRLSPAHVALLASQGKSTIPVYRRPRVAIFSSGDELVSVGGELAEGQIYETNSYALTALVTSCGAEALSLGIANDNFDDVKSHLQQAVDAGANLILSSAGVSVGAFDFLREALLSNGTLDFWKVNMRPGKPFTFGQYAGIPYIGLPGNPASAFVGFEVFVRPALQKMGGVAQWKRRVLEARLDESLDSDGRETYMRGHLAEGEQGLMVSLTGHQGSGNLLSLALADCLMIMPAGVTQLEPGAPVEVWPL